MSKLIEQLPAGFSFEMILVEGGLFHMGGQNDQVQAMELPVHRVTLPGFYIGKYPVTQVLWKAVMGDGNNPSFFQGDKRPVEMVSWDDAQAFLQKLNELTGKRYRLPTEAEWEYAARGGIHGQGYEYCGSDDLKQVGWYDDNSGGETKPVGLLLPNELGLYDMSGNIYEWCEDDWHSSYDAPGRPDDGNAWVNGPGRGARRVVRGGYYFSDPVFCRPAYRNDWRPDDRYYYVGFRLVLSLQF